MLENEILNCIIYYIHTYIIYMNPRHLTSNTAIGFAPTISKTSVVRCSKMRSHRRLPSSHFEPFVTYARACKASETAFYYYFFFLFYHGKINTFDVLSSRRRWSTVQFLQHPERLRNINIYYFNNNTNSSAPHRT